MKAKTTLGATALFALGLTVAQAADLNIGVTISGEVQPGVYGRIEIGNNPPPVVLYPQPVIIVKQRPGVVVAPIYLHVPPGHAKKWSAHCKEYNACGRPVYFVKSREYEPDHHDHEDGHHNGDHKSKSKNNHNKHRHDD